MEHGFCPSSWQCLWFSSLLFIGNKHASTRAVSSCWPEVIWWGLVRCCFTSFGTQTSTWAEEQASGFVHGPFRPVWPISTGHEKGFGKCPPELAWNQHSQF